MKVLGVTGKRYLVEMECDEIDILTGIGRGGWGDTDLKNVGRELQIRNPWRTIGRLEEAQNELPKLANKLRALADLLEPIAVEIPVVN